MNLPVTVIIADDHPVFRNGVRQALEYDGGFKVLGEAGDGERALECIKELQPSVAVLDVNMPKMSGLSLVKELKKINSATAIVLLTMFDDEEILNEAMDLGVKAYLLKDSASVDIASAVRSAVEGRHYISSALTDKILQRASKRASFEASHPALESLSPTERKILRLISESKSTKDIAAELFLSPKTVENYRFKISEKLNLRGSYSLLKFALENKTLL